MQSLEFSELDLTFITGLVDGAAEETEANLLRQFKKRACPENIRLAVIAGARGCLLYTSDAADE